MDTTSATTKIKARHILRCSLGKIKANKTFFQKYSKFTPHHSENTTRFVVFTWSRKKSKLKIWKLHGETACAILDVHTLCVVKWHLSYYDVTWQNKIVKSNTDLNEIPPYNFIFCSKIKNQWKSDTNTFGKKTYHTTRWNKKRVKCCTMYILYTVSHDTESRTMTH